MKKLRNQKPDRFERMVAAITNSDVDVGYDAICFPVNVVKLLRREHRAVVRLIRSMPHAPYLASDSLLRKEVLAQLIRRAT